MRNFLLTLAATLLCVAGGKAQETIDHRAVYGQALGKAASFSSDPCGPPYDFEENRDPASAVLNAAAGVVSDALSGMSHLGTAEATIRAEQILRELAAESAKVNAAWPVANRFASKALVVAPMLVVTMEYRTQARYFVYGRSAADGEKWRQVGEDSLGFEYHALQSRLEIYPLQRGPAGKPRFLASFVLSGCAGSLGQNYVVEEWGPSARASYLQELVEQNGAIGLDQAPAVPTAKNPFPSVGELQTSGRWLRLPYCWFSSIDTWDNPSMCALDTYDLAGNDIAFVSRKYNRPDLLPLAKALEYAGKHDYEATRAYCSSDSLARSFVRETPGVEDELTMTRTSASEEKINAGSGIYIVKKLGGRWLVKGYKSQ